MLKWLVSLMQCRGRHHFMMHFLGEKKMWECTRCGRVSPIPESLTRASGVFTNEACGSSRASSCGKQDDPKVQDIDQFKTRKKGA
jgi:hypothetical protein